MRSVAGCMARGSSTPLLGTEVAGRQVHHHGILRVADSGKLLQIHSSCDITASTCEGKGDAQVVEDAAERSHCVGRGDAALDAPPSHTRRPEDSTLLATPAVGSPAGGETID